MHRKVDRRMYLLNALAARHTRPVSRWQRTGGHKLGREAETLKPLQKAHNKEPRLVQRKLLSETLQQASNQPVVNTKKGKACRKEENSRYAGRRRTAST